MNVSMFCSFNSCDELLMAVADVVASEEGVEELSSFKKGVETPDVDRDPCPLLYGRTVSYSPVRDLDAVHSHQLVQLRLGVGCKFFV